MDDKEQSKPRIKNLAVKMKERYTKNQERWKLVEFCIRDLSGYDVVLTGSRAEGPHSDDSDTDILYMSKDLIAVPSVESVSIKNDNRARLLMTSTGVYPGHVKLMLPEESKHQTIDILSPKETLNGLCIDNETFISTKKVLNKWSVMASKVFHNVGTLKNTKLHGPSAQMTVSHSDTNFDLDFVYSVPCVGWPKEACKWFERKTKYKWPDETLRRHIHSLGTCIVPFGRSFDGSRSETDWRISFSLAEREIIWSLGGTELLCYEILKRISSHIKTKFPGCIQSYYFKTSFLWTLEQTSRDQWEPDEVISRVVSCIKWLTRNLKQGKIPNYFIPDNNMFMKEMVDDTLMKQLLVFLESVANSENDIWKPIIGNMHNFFRDDLLFKHHIHLDALALARQLAVCFIMNPRPEVCIKKITEIIEVIQKREPSSSNDCLVCLTPLLQSCQSLFGCLSFCLANEKIDEILHDSALYETAWQHLENGCFSDKYSGYLKKATVLNKLSHTDSALDIVNAVLNERSSHVVYMTPFKFAHQKNFDNYPKVGMSVEEFLREFVAYDVIFLPSEISISPDAVKYLLSDGHAVLIHPLIYARYIQFDLLFKQGRTEEFEESLASLSVSVQNQTIGNTHIGYVLLAQCLTQVGDYCKAAHYIFKAAEKGNNKLCYAWQLSVLLFLLWQQNY